MLRVLVVDDDPALRVLVGHILTMSNSEIIEADDGADALEILEQDAVFDVILADIRMARMDGLQFLDIVKRQYPAIPVIMVSVHRTATLANEALKRGAAGYLQKPFTIAELKEAIQNAVQGKASTGK
jgi:DNA-binding NtrC family response regulator